MSTQEAAEIPHEPVTPEEGAALPTPSSRVVLALAIPVLAQQGLHFFILMSDAFLASLLKEAADSPALQSAQTTAHYLAWFITCYTMFVTVGSTALVARFVGAGEHDSAVRVTHQSLLLALILSFVATALALGGGIDWLVGVLRLQGDAAVYASSYLQPLFMLLVFPMVESAGIACLTGAGDTRTGLYVMIGVTLLNLPLAWSFCWGWGPFPELGFVGIAVGTACSHALGACVVLGVLLKGRFGLKLHAAMFRPHRGLLRRLLNISIPSGIDQLSVVAGQFWFLTIVNRLGDAAGGAHGIALRWEALGFLSGSAFGTAAMTLVGQNLGARRAHLAARAGWISFVWGCSVMTLMGAVFFTFAPQMFGRFFPEGSRAIALGVPVLRLVAFAMPFLAATIVFTSALRGAGDTRVPVLFTWIGFFAVRIPLAYWLAQPSVDLWQLGSIPGLGLGLYGAWLAMFADLVVRGVFFFHRFARGRWQTQQV